MKIKEKVWSWLLNTAPEILKLYYKASGRSDSEEMAIVCRKIENNKKHQTSKEGNDKIMPSEISVENTEDDARKKLSSETAEIMLPKSEESTVVQPSKEINVKAALPNPNTTVQTNKKKETLKKLPYLNGAESAIVINSNLRDPHYLAKKIQHYDIISFDIFDTLILRPFTNPTDLFILIGEKHKINNFKSIRVNAEKKAREVAFVLNGTREITLKDIYDQVERETGISAAKGIETELMLEEKYCFANPYMKIIFDILKEQNKKIILTSDMYLNEKQITNILEKCGYVGYEKLFISCEYGCGKGGNGGIFKVIKNIYGENKRFCHIGDNYRNDILNARENGWDAVHFPNIHDVGRKYRANDAGMTELCGSMYAAVINEKLHNCLERYSEAFEYGYIYGGLYVFGYCNWIHEYVKKNNIDKVLFLSRDGDIYRRVYNLLFDDTDNQYIYWSRYPSIICCAEKDRQDYLQRFIRHRLNDVEPMTLEVVLKIAKIEFLIDKLPEYHLRAEAIIQKEFVGQLENMIIDNWDKIITSYQSEKRSIEKYLMSAVGSAKRVAVVDVGWLGSGPLAIKQIIEEKMEDCQVNCLCAASYSIPASQNIVLLMNETITCYLFNEFYNRNLKDYHTGTNKSCNNLFFELFTQAASPSLEEIDYVNDQISFGFGLAEVENYELLKEMHLGIVEFAIDYKKHFGDEPWLCNISGYDAYIPFKFLTQDLTIIKRVFGNYVISRNVGYDSSKNVMETLNSLLEIRGL